MLVVWPIEWNAYCSCRCVQNNYIFKFEPKKIKIKRNEGKYAHNIYDKKKNHTQNHASASIMISFIHKIKTAKKTSCLGRNTRRKSATIMLMIRACAAATIESMGVDALRVRILLPEQQQQQRNRMHSRRACVCLFGPWRATNALKNVIIQYLNHLAMRTISILLHSISDVIETDIHFRRAASHCLCINLKYL